jgi:hypothetical protein
MPIILGLRFLRLVLSAPSQNSALGHSGTALAQQFALEKRNKSRLINQRKFQNSETRALAILCPVVRENFGNDVILATEIIINNYTVHEVPIQIKV